MKDHNNNTLDRKIDELLAKRSAKASPDFTERALQRARAEGRSPMGALIAFPGLQAAAGIAAAAIMAVGLWLAQPAPQGPAEDVRLAAAPAHAEQADVNEAAAEEAYLLAEGLVGAETLLDDDALELFAMLAN